MGGEKYRDSGKKKEDGERREQSWKVAAERSRDDPKLQHVTMATKRERQKVTFSLKGIDKTLYSEIIRPQTNNPVSH